MSSAPDRANALNNFRTPYALLALLLIGSRLLLLGIAGLSLLIVRKGDFFTSPSGILDWFLRWDTGWYLGIANEGYSYTPGAQSSVAFFPLYPAVIALLGKILGGPVIAGYLVSNLALYGALVFLWKWIRYEYADSKLATNGCWFLLIGPVSFFFSTLYTESTFLFFSVGCLYFGRNQKWLAAGLLGYGASLTRNIGIFLVPALLWEYYNAWRHAEPSARRISFSTIACCLLPGLGLATYMAYLWNAFGDPLAFSRVQHAWARKLTFPWKVFYPWRIASMEPFYCYWFLGVVASTLFAIAAGFWLRVRFATMLIIIVPLLLYFSTNNLESIPRYISILFPLYLIAALLSRKSWLWERAMMAASLTASAISTILFVNGYWFT